MRVVIIKSHNVRVVLFCKRGSILWPLTVALTLNPIVLNNVIFLSYLQFCIIFQNSKDVNDVFLSTKLAPYTFAILDIFIPNVAFQGL